MFRKSLFQATRLFFEFGSTRCPQLRNHVKKISMSKLPALLFTATITSQVDDESVANSKKINETVRSACSGIPKGFQKVYGSITGHCNIGEDAMFKISKDQTLVCGVADGVGGWSNMGVNPSEFSGRLMRYCYEIVESGKFDPERPDLLLSDAFKKLSTSSNKPIGSSTACILVLDGDTLHSANLGDSGFLIWRNDKIIYKSKEQTHFFNAPYQLCIPPEETIKGRRFITDLPEDSDVNCIPVQKGDIILLGTDGLWDNLHDETIIKLLSLINEEDETSLQSICNSITLCARQLSLSQEYMSPFSLKAVKHGIETSGGKVDDISILIVQVL